MDIDSIGYAKPFIQGKNFIWVDKHSLLKLANILHTTQGAPTMTYTGEDKTREGRKRNDYKLWKKNLRLHM